jgi:hypothetical protein
VQLGFAVIQCPDPVHYYSLFSHTFGTDVVLTMYDRNRCVVRAQVCMCVLVREMCVCVFKCVCVYESVYV